MNPTRGSAQPASAFFSFSAGENMPRETIAGPHFPELWAVQRIPGVAIKWFPYAANVYHFTGQSMETLQLR
jgi:hypothetical protein